MLVSVEHEKVLKPRGTGFFMRTANTLIRSESILDARVILPFVSFRFMTELTNCVLELS